MLESAVIDTTHWRHLYLLWGMLWGPILAWELTHERLPALLRFRLRNEQAVLAIGVDAKPGGEPRI